MQTVIELTNRRTARCFAITNSKKPVILDLRTASGNTLIVATEIAMLFFYLPIIIFDAMLPNPKRKAGKPTAVG